MMSYQFGEGLSFSILFRPPLTSTENQIVLCYNQLYKSFAFVHLLGGPSEQTFSSHHCRFAHSHHPDSPFPCSRSMRAGTELRLYRQHLNGGGGPDKFRIRIW